MANDQNVSIDVHDVQGRYVRTLFDGFMTANETYDIVFDATGLPSGMDLHTVSGEHFRDQRKVILMK